MNVCTRCETKLNGSRCGKCNSSSHVKSTTSGSSSDLLTYSAITSISNTISSSPDCSIGSSFDSGSCSIDF